MLLAAIAYSAAVCRHAIARRSIAVRRYAIMSLIA